MKWTGSMIVGDLEMHVAVTVHRPSNSIESWHGTILNSQQPEISDWAAWWHTALDGDLIETSIGSIILAGNVGKRIAFQGSGPPKGPLSEDLGIT